MRSLVVLFALLLTPSAFAFSNAAVKAAKDLQDWVTRRQEGGEVTLTDKYQADKYVLDMRLKAGQLSKNEYCGPAIELQTKALNGVLEESRVGQRSMKDIMDEQSELSRLKALCGK